MMEVGKEGAAKIAEDILEQSLIFLDDLRESGITNMFGATPYLVDHFGEEIMSKRQARDVLHYWMRTFEKRHPANEEQDS